MVVAASLRITRRRARRLTTSRRTGREYGVYTFVRDFLAKNPTIDEATFQISDAMIEQFKQHITKRGVEFSGKDFQDNRDYMKRAMKYEIYYNRFGVAMPAASFSKAIRS